jgi:hypothetical protein
VHRTGCWDNAVAHDGRVPSWHRALRDRGHRVASIGKLYFRGHAGDDYGFTESLMWTAWRVQRLSPSFYAADTAARRRG